MRQPGDGNSRKLPLPEAGGTQRGDRLSKARYQGHQKKTRPQWVTRGHERNSAAARDGIQAGEEKILYFYPPQPTLQSPANESPRQHLASSLLTKHPGKQSLKSPLSAIQSRGEAEEEA